MMTRGHRQEALSRAYVHAVAALAGVLSSRPDPDYGIDLSLRAVDIHDRRHTDSSVQIDLQLKSTTRANVSATAVTYDLEVDTYNYLRSASAGCPRILVVYIMPEDEGEWLSQSPEELSLRHCAYWLSLEGAPATTAISSIRLSLPLTNVFSVDAVRALLKQAMQRRQP
jgi:Domain of unknown function (DUF4365)